MFFLARLVELLRLHLTQRTWQSLAALVRQADVHAWLDRTLPPEFGESRWLVALDELLAEHFPTDLSAPLTDAMLRVRHGAIGAPAAKATAEAVSGALMYFTRQGFERLGGFDEGYFMHVEDLDICRRAEADGGAVIYTPFASALHHGATSDAPSLVVEKYKAAGFSRYFRKFAETPLERAGARVLGPVIGFLLGTRARFRKW